MKKSYVPLILSAFILVTSCKKEKNKEEELPEVNLTLESYDDITYSENKFELKKGQTAHLTHKNTGQLPKEAMGHNFVLLKEGTDVVEFATEAFRYKDKDYIPTPFTSSIIVHSKLLGPGESSSTSIKIETPGTYDFICSFPGHHGTQKGKIIVK